MTDQIRDKATLRSVRLADLTSYLLTKGWSRNRAGYRHAELWYRDGAPDDAFVVPTSTDVVDFETRIAQALAALAKQEQRSPAQVLRDVKAAFADVIRLRRPTFSASPETIRLSEGVNLVGSAMEMVTSAACAALAPRKVIPNRRPLQASAYLGRVQLGQTEVGSYVLTIVSPLDDIGGDENHTLFPELVTPFPRRVTGTLVNALAAVRSATQHVRETGDYAAFDDAVEAGVSANLCESLASMVRTNQHESELGVRVTWGSIGGESRQRDDEFMFEPYQSEILRFAAQRFRAAEPTVDALITGLVVDLHRDEREVDGHVSIQAFIEGKTRKLKAPLAGPEYQLAIDAHKSKSPVLFRAELERIGRGWVATNIREFRVLA